MEVADLSENAVQRVVNAIMRVFSQHKEARVNVEELVEAGVPFDQDALEAMSDEQIAFLSQQAAPPQEPPATNDEETPDFAAEIEALRGEVTSLKEMLAANTDKERVALAATLASNAKCALSEEQLGKLDMDTLRGIEQSLVDPDYRGGGGGRETEGDEIVVLKAAPVLLKQKEV